jgi:hypothetical protein
MNHFKRYLARYWRDDLFFFSILILGICGPLILIAVTR